MAEALPVDPSEWVDRYGDYLFRGGILMLSCKDATRLISQSMDTSLPIGKRIWVRIHLITCRFCTRYERQLLLIRETLRRLAGTTDRPEGRAGENLSAEARDRIRKGLRNP